jgi:hypothetical protein
VISWSVAPLWSTFEESTAHPFESGEEKGVGEAQTVALAPADEARLVAEVIDLHGGAGPGTSALAFHGDVTVQPLQPEGQGSVVTLDRQFLPRLRGDIRGGAPSGYYPSSRPKALTWVSCLGAVRGRAFFVRGIRIT